MKPPAAAVELATAALTRLAPADRTRASLPAAIASGRALTEPELRLVADFWAQPPAPSDPDWCLAGHLLGGDPMRRAVAAAATPEEAVGQADPGPHTGAIVALRLDPNDAGLVAVDGGLEPDDLHVTVVHLGPAADWPELARVEILETVAEVVASWEGGLAASAGHIGHLGPDETGAVAVAYDLNTVSLHEFHRRVTEALRAAGVDFTERYAYRPHMTLTWLEPSQAETEWPPGPLGDNATVLTFPSVLVRFAESETTYTVNGPPPPPVEAVAAAAAAPGFPALSNHLEALWADLRALDTEAQTAVRTAIEAGWASALNRVGRMATRNASGALAESLAPHPPAAAAVVAGALAESLEDLLAGNAAASIVAPAVNDTVGHVARIIAQTQTRITATVAEAFAVDLTDVWPDPTDAVGHLQTALTDALLFRLGVLSDPNRIDPTTDQGDPLVVPYQLTRDVLALAGGGPLDRSAGIHTDSLALGPAATNAVDQAIAAWADAGTSETRRGPFVFTAAARRRAGANISTALSSELAEAAARLSPGNPDPLERVTTYTWRINYNGQATQNFWGHEPLDGVTVTSEAEMFDVPELQADPGEWPFVSVYSPGDHYSCVCGWETNVALVPRQGTLDV